MESTPQNIAGYTYAAPEVARSPVSSTDLEALKISVGMTAEDEHYRRMAGQVLADQTGQIVQHWRSGIIAGIPHLARHSRAVDGAPLPDYLARSNGRFMQWILDTLLRPYDQDWLNYQHEIALRHTTTKKNQTDGVNSTPYVPFRDILAFSAVMNETIKPYLAGKGHPAGEVEQMHRAWCRSMQLQLALWARAYTDRGTSDQQW